jgi:hypothetical protein
MRAVDKLRRQYLPLSPKDATTQWHLDCSIPQLPEVRGKVEALVKVIDIRNKLEGVKRDSVTSLLGAGIGRE